MADVQQLGNRCLQLGLPINLEWVRQTTPSLAGAATAAGLDVVRHPLLALPPTGTCPRWPAGVTVRIADTERGSLVSARAVATVAFGPDASRSPGSTSAWGSA